MLCCALQRAENLQLDSARTFARIFSDELPRFRIANKTKIDKSSIDLEEFEKMVLAIQAATT
jgi:hypothetical protein